MPSKRVFVRARSAAVDARELRAGREGDAGGERRQRNEYAPFNGNCTNLLALNDGSKAGGFGAEDRGTFRESNGD
jgi:hypothetical protein